MNEANDTRKLDLWGKRSMIWESIRLDLFTLRDFVSDCVNSLGLLEDHPPDQETWKKIKTFGYIAFRLLEDATALIDIVEGNQPSYENLYECMNEAKNIPLTEQVPEIVDFIATLSEGQKHSLLHILKRLKTKFATVCPSGKADHDSCRR